MKLRGTGHQAHQIHLEHGAKSLHLEFAAAIDHRALRQHQHVEPPEGRVEFLDRRGVADIEPEIIEAIEMRPFVRRIVGGGCARTADRDPRASGAERLRDAVADTAGAADHKHLPAAEIELVHLHPFPELFDPS